MTSVAKRGILWAAVVGPLAAIPASVPVALWGASSRREHIAGVAGLLRVLWEAGFVGLVALSLGYVFTTLVGVPAAFVAVKLGQTSLGATLVVGCVIGFAAALILGNGQVDTFLMPIALWYGFAISLAFWSVFSRVQRRPQHDSASSAA